MLCKNFETPWLCKYRVSRGRERDMLLVPVTFNHRTCENVPLCTKGGGTWSELRDIGHVKVVFKKPVLQVLLRGPRLN